MSFSCWWAGASLDVLPLLVAGPLATGKRRSRSRQQALIVYDQIAADIERKNPKTKSGQYRFIQDDRAVSNFIYGCENSLPPDDPENRGHYHAEFGEMRLMIGGQISYRIEDVSPFVADEGDIVYTTPFRFHSARFHGPKAACRLAMNGYAEIAHLFDTPQAREEDHIE